jgi:hypothetical protein
MTIQDPRGSRREGSKEKQAARRVDRDRKVPAKHGEGPDKGGDGAGRRIEPKHARRGHSEIAIERSAR